MELLSKNEIESEIMQLTNAKGRLENYIIQSEKLATVFELPHFSIGTTDYRGSKMRSAIAELSGNIHKETRLSLRSFDRSNEIFDWLRAEKNVFKVSIDLFYLRSWIYSSYNDGIIWNSDLSTFRFESFIEDHYREFGIKTKCYFPMARIRKTKFTEDFFDIFGFNPGCIYVSFEKNSDAVLLKMSQDDFLPSIT